MSTINYQEIFDILNENNIKRNSHIELIINIINYHSSNMSEDDFNLILKWIAEENITELINYIKYMKFIKNMNEFHIS
jgi:hypothetical protein